MKYRDFRHGALLFILASAHHISSGETIQANSIWEVIESMRQVPINETAVQDLFGAKIDSRSDNGYWKTFEGKGQTLADGVTVPRFGFRTKNGEWRRSPLRRHFGCC